MEHSLWEMGLWVTIALVYLNGLYFALRSGEEHRRLRYKPCQIKVVNTVGQAPHIMYCEDISKTNQGGLRSRKVIPKKVIHHANEETCLVKLFLKYNSFALLTMLLFYHIKKSN